MFLITPTLFAGELQCYDAHARLKKESPNWEIKIYRQKGFKNYFSWIYPKINNGKRPSHKDQMLLQEISEACGLAGMGRMYRGIKDGHPTHGCMVQRNSYNGRIALDCLPGDLAGGDVKEMKL